ncbi:hypothetical protein B0O95_11915 [Mycetohabitans endofungorum]|uniref:Uncharacterized protein n=1 Tax=Mycetohabitans endofungorum TaxID=417203 RepID=A0A2P5K723_9BURK|nr:hypothetical protein B0O95_11915 [Mycetohabitans endofungorum]
MDVSRAFYDITRHFSAHVQRNAGHSRLRSMPASPFLLYRFVSTASLPSHVRSIFRVRAALCARPRAEQAPCITSAFVKMASSAVALSGRHGPSHRADQARRGHRLSQAARHTPVAPPRTLRALAHVVERDNAVARAMLRPADHHAGASLLSNAGTLAPAVSAPRLWRTGTDRGRPRAPRYRAMPRAPSNARYRHARLRTDRSLVGRRRPAAAGVA